MNEPLFPRVALYLQDAHPIRDGMAYAQYAEARGFEAVWQAESRLVRDAIVPMAAYAAATQRINVALADDGCSGVAPLLTDIEAVVRVEIAGLIGKRHHGIVDHNIRHANIAGIPHRDRIGDRVTRA